MNRLSICQLHQAAAPCSNGRCQGSVPRPPDARWEPTSSARPGPLQRSPWECCRGPNWSSPGSMDSLHATRNKEKIRYCVGCQVSGKSKSNRLMMIHVDSKSLKDALTMLDNQLGSGNERFFYSWNSMFDGKSTMVSWRISRKSSQWTMGWWLAYRFIILRYSPCLVQIPALVEVPRSEDERHPIQ